MLPVLRPHAVDRAERRRVRADVAALLLLLLHHAVALRRAVVVLLLLADQLHLLLRRRVLLRAQVVRVVLHVLLHRVRQLVVLLQRLVALLRVPVDLVQRVLLLLQLALQVPDPVLDRLQRVSLHLVLLPVVQQLLLLLPQILHGVLHLVQLAVRLLRARVRLRRLERVRAVGRLQQHLHVVQVVLDLVRLLHHVALQALQLLLALQILLQTVAVLLLVVLPLVLEILHRLHLVQRLGVLRAVLRERVQQVVQLLHLLLRVVVLLHQVVQLRQLLVALRHRVAQVVQVRLLDVVLQTVGQALALQVQLVHQALDGQEVLELLQQALLVLVLRLLEVAVLLRDLVRAQALGRDVQRAVLRALALVDVAQHALQIGLAVLDVLLLRLLVVRELLLQTTAVLRVARLRLVEVSDLVVQKLVVRASLLLVLQNHRTRLLREHRHAVDRLHVAARLVVGRHRVEDRGHVGQHRLVIDLLVVEVLRVQKPHHFQIVLHLVVSAAVTIVLLHRLRLSEVIVVTQRSRQSSKSLSISPALGEIAHLLTIGLDLTVHPQEQTVHSLQAIHLNVIDLNEENDLENQTQSQLVISVENINRTDIHQLHLLLQLQIVKARLQVLCSLKSELRGLIHAPTPLGQLPDTHSTIGSLKRT